MNSISHKKVVKIGKLIATTKYIAVHSMGEMDKKTQIENMSKIIENLAEIAFEIGRERFAMIDVPAAEYTLKKALEKQNDVEIRRLEGWKLK